MHLHRRFVQQAVWTRELREYLLARARFDGAVRVLEVGCGTGAVLQELAGRTVHSRSSPPSIHGTDVAWFALTLASRHAPAAHLSLSDAHDLPYADGSFEIACCHFLLLWVRNPLAVVAEMRRVTRRAGFVIAFAEPDYSARVYRPDPVARLGDLQARSLQARGADTDIGSKIAALFDQCGLAIVEAGLLATNPVLAKKDPALLSEWEIIREDLRDRMEPADLDVLLKEARQESARQPIQIHVPTHFVIAQV